MYYSRLNSELVAGSIERLTIFTTTNQRFSAAARRCPAMRLFDSYHFSALNDPATFRSSYGRRIRRMRQLATA